jgi:low temperature requirement protein LtrA
MGRGGVRIRMSARSTDEPHRAASQLELLFDLTFVIAVAHLVGRFAHAVADAHALDELVPFLQVFFAIWWAWVNYTWFASAFDTDDVAFRLLTLVQMGGVLVLAAGVPAAFDDGEYGAVTLGYVIMRLGLVAQWLRAALEDPASRRTALRYATGITFVTVLWALRLWVGEALLAVFVALVVLELCVPLWAERKGATSWHPHHIAERYGLFAIILLGEGVFVASTGVEAVLATGDVSAALVAVAVSALALVFALWWLYFLQPAGDGLASHRDRSYIWGYGSFGIFAALTAVGAGLEVAVEDAGHHVAASPVAVGYAIAIPVAAFLVLLWALHAPLLDQPVCRPTAMLGGSLVILLLPLAAHTIALAVVVAAISVTSASIVAITIARERVPRRRGRGVRVSPEPAAQMPRGAPSGS